MRNWIPRLLVAALMLAGGAAAAERQYAWLRGWDAHGRAFDLASLRGQMVMLTFASKQTRDEASDINEELTKHAVPGDVTVVSVIDLENIPGFGYKTARKKIADADQPGLIRHVVDEHGALRRSYGVDPIHEVPIFVIGRDGSVLGRFSGEQGLPQAIELVERLK